MDRLAAMRPGAAHVLVLFVTVLASTSARAQEPPPKIKLAIMNLRGVKGVDEELTQVVAQYLATKIDATGRYTVITRDDVKSMLEHEQLKMEVGCDEEASCLAELGGALGVDLMVSGTLAVMGSEVLVNLSLIDVRKATVVRRTAEKGPLAGTTLDEATLKAIDVMLPRLLPDESKPVAANTGRVWTWVAAGVSVAALAGGAGLMWFGNNQLEAADRMANGGTTIDYQDFQATYDQGQAGWYGGMATLGLGVVAAGVAVALFFVEADER